MVKSIKRGSMAYEIILGRTEEERAKYGLRGTILLGKHYVRMGQTTSLSSPVFLDVAKSHVVLVAGKRGCLTGDTKVFTDKGYKDIKDIAPATDRVLSHDKKTGGFIWENVELLRYKVNENEELIKLEFTDGQDLILTQEHPLLVYYCGRKFWKKAGDLTTKDKIIALTKVPEVNNDSYGARTARLLGFILADGTINIRKGRWRDSKGYWYNGTKHRIRIFNADENVLMQAKKDFEEEFSIKATRYKRRDCNCEVIGVEDSQVVKKFIELGIPFGNKAGIIRVPRVVWTHSNAFKKEFLKALFSCDGTVEKDGSGVQYSSKSKKFLDDLHLLLQHFNIQSTIRFKKAKIKNKTYPNYVLGLYDHTSLENFKRIGFFVDLKQQKLRKHKFSQIERRKKTTYLNDGVFCLKIRKMGRVGGISEVYDLSVPKNHSFIANGVVSHNSGKSYTLGTIAEGISDLPAEVKENTSVILLDTMGIYWTMKYPNNKDAELLREWGMEGKPLDVKIFTPSGFFKEFKEKGIPTDYSFSLRPAELEPEDWFLTFELNATEPLSVFIEKTILKLKEERGEDYDIDDIIEYVKLDKEEEAHIKGAAINRFEAVKRWGVFSKQGTEMKEIAKPGQVTVLDLSCYAAMAEGWRIKCLVIGVVAEKLFMERMAARREEEFRSIQSAIHYFEAEKESVRMPLIWLVIDEAHEFLPHKGKTAATDALVTILREGRQPGMSLVLATQQPGKIHTDVMTQSDIIISHRVTAKVDIEALQALLATYMRTGMEKEMDLLPRVAGAGVAVDDVNERMYPMRVRPRFTWHGGAAPMAIPEKKTIFEFK